MVANETSIHRSTKRVDVSNYRQPCGFEQLRKKHIIKKPIKDPDMKNIKQYYLENWRPYLQ